MPLGIRPINDLAFKKTFGTPENKLSLISLLNAILKLLAPIVDVRIENPYNLQDFELDKLSILDIKATDLLGRIFHIEMQLSVFSGLIQRFVFYGCELYAGQLKSGEDYSELQPVYSICLVDGILWKDPAPLHQRFQLCNKSNGRVLENTLEIHILELGRYNLEEADLNLKTSSPLEYWLFWLLHAHKYESDELMKLFPEVAFQQATRSITQISQKTEDKAMYDARERAIRDYQSALNSALREGKLEGKREGKVEGKLEGKVEGKLEGERIGEQRGRLMERVTMLQEILKISPTDEQVLRGMATEELVAMATELQKNARSRSSS